MDEAEVIRVTKAVRHGTYVARFPLNHEIVVYHSFDMINTMY